MSKLSGKLKMISWVLLALLFTACKPGTDDNAQMATAVQQTIAARDAQATQSTPQEEVAAVIPTLTPTATLTSTPIPPSPTPTSVPPTPTATPIPPLPTFTPIPPPPALSALLDPNYGSTSLSAGFLPDPYTTGLISGGSVDVSYLNNGFGCTGYATAAPDLRLFWSGEGDELNFQFTANSSQDDTTLIINDPNGYWHCNDDLNGINPGIRFSNALSGQYDIWIGSYAFNDNISGQLSISEFAASPESDQSQSGELNPALDPNYGSTSLSAGFVPDPYATSLTSGGDVDVSYLNNGFGCTGYATAAPDFRLFWSGEGDELNFQFIANSSQDDTTLIINDPSGNWVCNDDFNGTNPGIRFNNASSGQYDIWIGSYAFTDNISGQLNITEFAIP